MKLLLSLAATWAIFCLEVYSAPSSETDSAVATLLAGAAKTIAPLECVDGIISQPQKTELPAGGKALFEFSVEQSGDYVLKGLVNAPSESKNSFYVNIDAPPEDPAMIWDFDVTQGFEERAVSWRGSGDADWSEFNPKIFHLSAGKHQIFLVGREPAQLKSFSILRWVAPVHGSLDEIKAHYNESDARYEKEIRKLTDAPESQGKLDELAKQNSNDHGAEFQAALQIARDHPKSTAGFAAIEWLLTNPRSYYSAAGMPALKIFNDEYATEASIEEMLGTLIRFLPDREDSRYELTLALLNNVLANNSYRNARGYATYGLALIAKQKHEEAEAEGEKPKIAKSSAEAVKAFELLLKEYGDCPDVLANKTSSQKKTLGLRATRALHEIRDLSIGKHAPDISAEDTDGVPFKLSDYRGKVILLVFWASWCGPCMNAVPHEKELVEHFKGRPFVLIGVNGDNSPHDAAKAVKKNGIPWRSFWDSAKGSGTRISSEWNIRGWPTIYVIDHAGVIREKYLYGPRLDGPLEKWVVAAEKAVH